MNERTKKVSFAAVAVSCVFLFLPNFLIVDLMPDFVACFLLAAVFRKGIDTVPYFAEARTSLLRLGYLHLAKIAGLALIVFVRSKNTSDNDILALVCTVFASAELVLSLITAKHVFDGLFYFGERSEVSSLISWKQTDAEPIRLITYLFITVKCLAYAIPQFFALSHVNENGSVSAVKKSYPAMLAIFFLLALAVGIAWLVRILRYARNVHKEGRFAEELDRLTAQIPAQTLKIKKDARSLSRVAAFGTLALFCLFSLRFENLSEIDLLPRPLHAILFFFLGWSLLSLAGAEKTLRTVTLVSGTGYLLTSTTAYALDCVFRQKYQYPAEGISEKEFLLSMANGEAGRFYRTVEFSSGAELAFAVFSAVSICLLLLQLIKSRTLGRKTQTIDYTLNEKSLRIKAIIYTASVVTVYAGSFGSVLLGGAIRSEELLQGDGTTVPVIVTRWPWYGTALFAVTLLAAAIGVTFFHSLKEELSES